MLIRSLSLLLALTFLVLIFLALIVPVPALAQVLDLGPHTNTWTRTKHEGPTFDNPVSAGTYVDPETETDYEIFWSCGDQSFSGITPVGTTEQEQVNLAFDTSSKNWLITGISPSSPTTPVPSNFFVYKSENNALPLAGFD